MLQNDNPKNKKLQPWSHSFYDKLFSCICLFFWIKIWFLHHVYTILVFSFIKLYKPLCNSNFLKVAPVLEFKEFYVILWNYMKMPDIFLYLISLYITSPWFIRYSNFILHFVHYISSVHVSRKTQYNKCIIPYSPLFIKRKCNFPTDEMFWK